MLSIIVPYAAEQISSCSAHVMKSRCPDLRVSWCCRVLVRGEFVESGKVMEDSVHAK